MKDLKSSNITEAERKLIEPWIDEILQSVGWADLERRLDGGIEIWEDQMNKNNIENARITHVSLSMEDHGCLTFWLTLAGHSWGCGYGGFAIGHGYLGAETFTAENGGGLVAMMKIMDTVGVSHWEDLEGELIRVKTDGLSGSRITTIGNIIKDKWFDIDEFFKDYEKAAE